MNDLSLPTLAFIVVCLAIAGALAACASSEWPHYETESDKAEHFYREAAERFE